MPANQLTSFLSTEKEFFADALAAQQALTPEEKALFRTETIAQRRERLSQDIFEKLKGKVAHGHFKGLELDPVPGWGKSDLASMLLGCYEIEVIDALHAPSLSHRSHFVDIGGADGYYAVGALRNQRFNTADCFELTQIGRDTIARNAEANDVSDRLRIFGTADHNLPAQLKGTDWSNTVVLCDIEGAEFDLLDENCLKAMKGAEIIIEIHNWVEDFWPKYEALIGRASELYSLKMLERSALPTHPLPELRGMPDDNRMLLLSEGRPNVMRFLHLSSE